MPKKYKYTKTFTFEGKRYVVRADTKKVCLMKMTLRLRDLEEGRILISGNMSVREWSERAMNISMGCKTYRNALIPPYPLAADFVPYCLRHT